MENSFWRTTRASLEPWFWSSRGHHFYLDSTRPFRLAALSSTSPSSTFRNPMVPQPIAAKPLLPMSLTLFSSPRSVPWVSCVPTDGQPSPRSPTTTQAWTLLTTPSRKLIARCRDVWCDAVVSGRCPRPRSNSPRRWATARPPNHNPKYRINRPKQRRASSSSTMTLSRSTPRLKLPRTPRTYSYRWPCKHRCRQPTLEVRCTVAQVIRTRLTRALQTAMIDFSDSLPSV